MASNIGSDAGFTSTNMKPASGEQVDSLWGQNVADNTGYLRARLIPLFQHFNVEYTYATSFASSASDRVGTQYMLVDAPIFRSPGHTHMRGTFSASITFDSSGQTPDNYGTIIWGIYGDLGTYLNTTTLVQNNDNNHSYATTFSGDFSFDTYLSENKQGRFRATIQGTLSDFGGAASTDLTYLFGSFNAQTAWV